MPRIPKKWKSFPIATEGEGDYACGLYCIAAAAAHFEILAANDVRALLAKLKPHLQRRLALKCMTKGLYSDDLKKLGEGVELSVVRPRHPNPGQFQNCKNQLWIAAVKINPQHPKGLFSTEEAHHLVLVLDYLKAEDAFIIADPHPWNEQIRRISRDDFESMWQQGRINNRQWAAAIKQKE